MGYAKISLVGLAAAAAGVTSSGMATTVALTDPLDPTKPIVSNVEPGKTYTAGVYVSDMNADRFDGSDYSAIRFFAVNLVCDDNVSITHFSAPLTDDYFAGLPGAKVYDFNANHVAYRGFPIGSVGSTQASGLIGDVEFSVKPSASGTASLSFDNYDLGLSGTFAVTINGTEQDLYFIRSADDPVNYTADQANMSYVVSGQASLNTTQPYTYNINVVPEPSITMMAAGVAVAALARRQRWSARRR